MFYKIYEIPVFANFRYVVKSNKGWALQREGAPPPLATAVILEVNAYGGVSAIPNTLTNYLLFW
jgi:hypothetical protein